MIVNHKIHRKYGKYMYNINSTGFFLKRKEQMLPMSIIEQITFNNAHLNNITEIFLTYKHVNFIINSL